MAAITVGRARPVTPVGYEVVDKITLSEDVLAGDELVYTGTMLNGQAVMSKAPITGITEAQGIALKNGFLGQEGFDVGIQGEMDGFSALTPGAPLYPSIVTAGKLDTAVISGAVVRVRAVTDKRIRFNYV